MSRNRKYKEHNRDIPYISIELIEWLDKQYPELIPDVDMDMNRIMKYSGKRELVLRLREIYNEANK